MNLNFSKPTQISFETEVVGTNTPAELVRVVITNGSESFAKNCSLVDNRWEVIIPEFKILDSYIAGIKQLLIEFKVNGRIFTPYKKEVSFNSSETISTVAPDIAVPNIIPVALVVGNEVTDIATTPSLDLDKPKETYSLFKGFSTEQKEEKKPAPIKEVKAVKKEFKIKKFDDKESIDVKSTVSKSDFMVDDVQQDNVEMKQPHQVKENIFVKIHKAEVIYL